MLKNKKYESSEIKEIELKIVETAKKLLFDENADFKNPTEKWNKNYFSLCEMAKTDAKLRWSHVVIENGENETDFYKIVASILKNYKIPESNNIEENNHFLRYFVTSLNREVFRNFTEYKTLMFRGGIKIPVRTQKKINKLLAVMKKGKVENLSKIETQIWLCNQLNDEKNWSLEKIHKLALINEGFQSVNSNDEKICLQEELNSENKELINKHLELFFENLSAAFDNKMNTKKQNDEAQNLKLSYESSLATLYFFKEFIEKNNINDWHLIHHLFDFKSFCNEEILNRLEKGEKIYFASISEKYGRSRSYASQRLNKIKSLICFVRNS